jgi:hypothetical protein
MASDWSFRPKESLWFSGDRVASLLVGPVVSDFDCVNATLAGLLEYSFLSKIVLDILSFVDSSCCELRLSASDPCSDVFRLFPFDHLIDTVYQIAMNVD